MGPAEREQPEAARPLERVPKGVPVPARRPPRALPERAAGRKAQGWVEPQPGRVREAGAEPAAMGSRAARCHRKADAPEAGGRRPAWAAEARARPPGAGPSRRAERAGPQPGQVRAAEAEPRGRLPAAWRRRRGRTCSGPGFLWRSSDRRSRQTLDFHRRARGNWRWGDEETQRAGATGRTTRSRHEEAADPGTGSRRGTALGRRRGG